MSNAPLISPVIIPKFPRTTRRPPLRACTPAYHDIRIENLSGNSPEGAGLIVGLPESPVRGITLSNVQLRAVTGLLVKNAADVDVDRGEDRGGTGRAGDRAKTPK